MSSIAAAGAAAAAGDSFRGCSRAVVRLLHADCQTSASSEESDSRWAPGLVDNVHEALVSADQF